MPPESMGVAVIVDATITIGNMIEIAVIAGGGIAALATVRGSVKNLTRDITNMRGEFTDMKSEIKKVGEVLIRMEATDRRLTNVEQDVREMRHGHGFITGDIVR